MRTKKEKSGILSDMKIQLDPPLYAKEISDALGVAFSGNTARTFTHLATSSDECDVKTLFIALEGKRRHGNEFIPSLARFGVASIGGHACKNTFCVSSGLDALMRLAAYRKKRLHHLSQTVGITGSVGKTTTKDATALLLAQKYHVHKTPSNLNSEIGLSLSILASPPDTEVLVLELGINHPGEMSRLSALANPDIAVITNVGLSHIGNFSCTKDLIREKARIASKDTRALLIDSAIPSFPEICDALRVGEGGVYQLLPLVNDTRLFLHPEGALPLSSAFMEGDIEAALLFALSVGRLLGLSDTELSCGAEEVCKMKGRRCVQALGGITLIDDSYNASLESIDLALSVLCRGGGKRFAVLSDVLELGDRSEEIHERIGERIATHAPDGVFFLGDQAHSVRKGAVRGGYDTGKIVALGGKEHERCALLLSQVVKAGDRVLLKGSHGGELWRVGEHLAVLLNVQPKNKKEEHE